MPLTIGDFLYEIGLLKRYPRTGWLVAGVTNVESIAEHSFRTAIIASIVAELEGADPNRAALLACYHDMSETRILDIPHVSRSYVSTVDPRTITADQVKALPGGPRTLISHATDEYETGSTLEAQCAHDADKLECLIQACEYRAQGHEHVQGWIDRTSAGFRTSSAHQIAKEILESTPIRWQDHHLYDDLSE